MSAVFDNDLSLRMLTTLRIGKLHSGARAFRNEEAGKLPKPLSGGFPEGLIDRAFYARDAGAYSLKACLNGLKIKSLPKR